MTSLIREIIWEARVVRTRSCHAQLRLHTFRTERVLVVAHSSRFEEDLLKSTQKA